MEAFVYPLLVANGLLRATHGFLRQDLPAGLLRRLSSKVTTQKFALSNSVPLDWPGRLRKKINVRHVLASSEPDRRAFLRVLPVPCRAHSSGPRSR
jgi:hypothetical protein